MKYCILLFYILYKKYIYIYIYIYGAPKDKFMTVTVQWVDFPKTLSSFFRDSESCLGILAGNALIYMEAWHLLNMG